MTDPPGVATATDSDIPALVDVLIDAVVNGASVGWTDPPTATAAAAWWRARLAAPDIVVFVIRVDARAVGTVSLVLESRDNGRHRAEVAKLMVHSSQRGRGLGRHLMDAAEESARANGRTLLLLDTETGSTSERLYAKWGWQPWGTIPDYAISPTGVTSGTTFFMKHLG